MKHLILASVSFLILLIQMACSKQNEPPIIQSLTANPETIYPNRTTQLTCIATDPESDNLSYLWASTNGTFPNTNIEASLNWKAPDEHGTYNITVSVNDGKNTTVKTITIEVLQSFNIEGYVYFAGTTIPIPGVQIHMGDEEYTTNESGQFTTKIGLGIQNIKANKNGFDAFDGEITIGNADDKIKIELTSLDMTKKISGMVNNSFDLTPLEGATVVLLNPDGSESELFATTSFSGYYEIESVPVGVRLIIIKHPFYRTIEQNVFIADTEIKLDVNMDCAPPEIKTMGNSIVGLDSVVLEGLMYNNCNQNIRTGFCFSEKSNPNINDKVFEVQEESGMLRKVVSLQDVERLTPYYYRAFVQTDFEIVYGDTYSFLLGILVDERNNETRLYSTTQIGEQLWMAENLAYLPKLSPANEVSETEANYFVYGFTGTSISEAKTSKNFQTYGVLYNWPAAINACPDGWHLPTNEDWEQLAKYVSDENGGYSNKDNYWYNVGIHLKSETLWRSNGTGTDDYGFSGLPGGFRSFDGNFYNIESDAYWWSATEESNGWVWHRNMKFSSTSIFRGKYFKNMAYCVRCLKD